LPPIARAVVTIDEGVKRELAGVRKRLMTGTSDDRFQDPNKVWLSPRVKKKTFTHGIIAWIKVLLTGLICPGSGSFDRDDGIRVGHFSGR
jgi:hypothetical protein